VAKQRERQAYEQRVAQSWLTGLLVMKGFHEPRKFPTLARLLAPVRQSVSQQRSAVEAIAAAFNLKLRRGQKKR
jgi:hypothetical protein